MAGFIDALLELQEVDIQIRNLKLRLVMIPKERAELKEQRNTERESLNETHRAIQETEVKLRSLESLMIKHQNANAKLQQRSTQIRNNDEYQALMKEIDFNRAKISDLETEIIVLMDKLDNMKRNSIRKKEECDARLDNISADLENLASLESEVRDMLGELAEVRDERAAKVNADVLTAYEHILKKNADKPAVKIINGNICGNCRLKLTPQTVNTGKSGKLTLCDNCSHIVYFVAEDE